MIQKSIKYLLSAAMATTLLVSCYDDDHVDVVENSANIVTVNATISTQRTNVGEGDLVPVTVTLDRAVDSTSTVGVQVEFGNSSFTRTYFTLPAGSTSVTGNVVTPAPNLNFAEGIGSLPNFASFEVIGLASNVAGTQFDIVSNVAQANVFDRFPGVNLKSCTVLFDWEGAPQNDLDMVIYGPGGSGTGFTGSRYEQIELPELVADGDYTVELSFYTVATTPISFNLFFRLEDGATVIYSGEQTFTQAEIDAGFVNKAIITKATVNGEATYSITEL